jgi:hypothetical protein
MTMFARGLRKDQVVNQVMEFAHVRYLPMYEAKNILFDRLNVTNDAAEAFWDFVEAESGMDDVRSKVTFDEIAEDASVQDLVSLLNMLLNAKVECSAARVSPIKVKLNTPMFSGRSRDFAIYKKEFKDVIVSGPSYPEIGELLSEGLNTNKRIY